MSRILLVLAALAAAAVAILPSLASGAATTRRCAAADLSAKTFGTGGSGAGTLEFGVRLRNTSGSACFMKGFAGLGLRNASELRMRGFAAFDTSKTLKRVALSSGAFAHFLVRYTRRAERPATRIACPTSQLPARDAAEPPRPARGARPRRALLEGPDAGDAGDEGQGLTAARRLSAP